MSNILIPGMLALLAAVVLIVAILLPHPKGSRLWARPRSLSTSEAGAPLRALAQNRAQLGAVFIHHDGRIEQIIDVAPRGLPRRWWLDFLRDEQGDLFISYALDSSGRSGSAGFWAESYQDPPLVWLWMMHPKEHERAMDALKAAWRVASETDWVANDS